MQDNAIMYYFYFFEHMIQRYSISCGNVLIWRLNRFSVENIFCPHYLPTRAGSLCLYQIEWKLFMKISKIFDCITMHRHERSRPLITILSLLILICL